MLLKYLLAFLQPSLGDIALVLRFKLLFWGRCRSQGTSIAVLRRLGYKYRMYLQVICPLFLHIERMR